MRRSVASASIDVLARRALLASGDGRRGADARIGIGQQRAGERRSIFVADRRERADRCRAHARIGSPSMRRMCGIHWRAMSLRTAPSAANARRRTIGRLVIEEQRRDEVPLVERSRARRWRRPRASDPDAQSSCTSVSIVVRSATFKRSSLACTSRVARLWRNVRRYSWRARSAMSTHRSATDEAQVAQLPPGESGRS